MRVPTVSCGAALLTAPLAPLPAITRTTGVLEGIAVEAGTGRSIEGVRLTVVGTDLACRTDAHGTFRFAGLPAGDVVLRAERDGYVTFTDGVQVRAGLVFSFEIRMETLGAVLDEFRVFARRPSPATLIRGPKSLVGRNAPTVFVDGVRVDETDAGLFGGAAGPSVLDAIPAESIDSIRVLRGPSAAAFRGADTANGVILVYTKRGGG